MLFYTVAQEFSLNRLSLEAVLNSKINAFQKQWEALNV